MTTTEPRPDYVVDLAEYANDPERITEFSVWNDDVTSVIHTVEDNADAIRHAPAPASHERHDRNPNLGSSITYQSNVQTFFCSIS